MSLNAQDINVSFGGLRALAGVSATVEPGQVVSVIGANGSGKSTLFNAISGFVRPRDGSVTLDGLDMTRMPPYQRARRGIARTFQTPRVDFAATVHDSLLSGMTMMSKAGMLRSMLTTPRSRSDERTIRQRGEELLETFALEDCADVAVETLPMGRVRVLEVARVMATRPKYLLLDEPAAGLHHDEQEILVAGIRRVCEQGVGVLLVEHNFALVRSISEHVIVLERGEELLAGPVEEVAKDPRFVSSYLGELSDDADEERR